MVIGSLAAFALFILISLFAPMESPLTTRWLLAAFGGVCLLPFLRWLSKRQIDFFEIIYPITISYFLYFVLSPRETMPETGMTFPWLTDIHLNRALFYTGLGFSMLLSGYYGPVGPNLARRLPRLRLSPRPAQLHQVIYLLYAIGLCLRLFLLAKGGHTWSTKYTELEFGTVIPGPWENVVGYLGNFSLFAVTMATAAFFSEGRTKTLTFLLWGIMLPSETLWVFLQGSKSHFIPILAAPFIAYNYLRKRVSVGHLVLPALFMAFIVFPAVSEYRVWAHEYPIQLTTIPQALPQIAVRLTGELLNPESEAHLSGGAEMVIQRATGLLPFANVIQYTEDNGFLHGETLWQFILIIIPEIIFPKKPTFLISSGDLYSQDIYGLSESTSGIALMQAGEFYLNYGTAGIIIGMFLQGILYRVWQIYWVGFGTPLSIALFILGWRILTLIELPFSFAFGELLREILLMIPLLWLLARSQSAGSKPVLKGP